MREPPSHQKTLRTERRGAGRLATLVVYGVALLVGSGSLAAAAPTAASTSHEAAAAASTASNCAASLSLEGASIAVLGDLPPANQNLTNWLTDLGLSATRVFWDDVLDDVSTYDVIVFNRQLSPWPTQEEVLQFVDDTDDDGTSVVFLSGSSGQLSGIGHLSVHAGNPGEVGSMYAQRTSFHKSYDVVAEHPVLSGFDIGEHVIITGATATEPGFQAIAWFNGYEGGQVLADVGTRGSGIGTQERENNRHVLLSQHEIKVGTLPAEADNRDAWSTDAVQIFLNALEWAVPAGTSSACR